MGLCGKHNGSNFNEFKENYDLPNDHPFNEVIEDENDKTLLMIACEKLYSSEYLSVLLNIGVSASLYNVELEKCPIHFASREKNEIALQLLLENGADCNALIYRSGRTALHICAEENFLEGIQVLLHSDYSEHIDVNIKDNKGGITPLYIAIKNKNEDMITVLLEYGADLSHVCFNKSLKEHLKAILPNYDSDAVQVKKQAKKASDHDVKMWQLNTLIERYSISVDENEKKDIYNEFQSILSTMDPTKGDYKRRKMAA